MVGLLHFNFKKLWFDMSINLAVDTHREGTCRVFYVQFNPNPGVLVPKRNSSSKESAFLNDLYI